MLSSKNADPREREAILSLIRLPGRLNTTETALLLGIQEHDIAPLVKARLLKPLGDPTRNAPKYFASSVIEEKARDERFLSKMTETISKHWSVKNQVKVLRNRRGAEDVPKAGSQ